MTQEELIALARLIKFIIGLPEIEKVMMNQSQEMRDQLFCDAATLYFFLDRNENEPDKR